MEKTAYVYPPSQITWSIRDVETIEGEAPRNLEAKKFKKGTSNKNPRPHMTKVRRMSNKQDEVEVLTQGAKYDHRGITETQWNEIQTEDGNKCR